MPLIKKLLTQDVEIRLSAREVADLFWMMDEGEQCEFFNTLGGRKHIQLSSQMQCVTDCEILDENGRWAMNTIGEYSKKNP